MHVLPSWQLACLLEFAGLSQGRPISRAVQMAQVYGWPAWVDLEPSLGQRRTSEPRAQVVAWKLKGVDLACCRWLSGRNQVPVSFLLLVPLVMVDLETQEGDTH